MWNDHHGNENTMMDGGSWVVMALMMLLVIVLVAGLLGWISVLLRERRREAPSPASRGSAPSPAGEHLASRFAKGEIEAEEFEHRVDVLRRARLDRP